MGNGSCEKVRGLLRAPGLAAGAKIAVATEGDVPTLVACLLAVLAQLLFRILGRRPRLVVVLLHRLREFALV